MTAEINCPKCSSANVFFSKKRGLNVCEECEHEFAAEKRVAPLRIFLSYGHDANEELVRRIQADLARRGHDVWFDKNEIKFGDEWRRSITDGIVNSHRVLSFLSKHSTRDPGVCLDEIAIAIGVKGGNIQTILVEGEQEVKPPASISHIQWLDMHDWKERKERGLGIPPEHPDSWEQWYQAKLAEIVQVVESDESRRFAGEIQTLAEYLKPIASDSRIATLLKKGFIGRKWLFDAVENWRNPKSEIQNPKSPSRLFWITGDPGVGKSAFAAHLTHFGRDKVIAAQFVEWDKPDHRHAARVVRSLAFQLATRLPDYRKLLLTLPEIAELDRKDPAELFDYLLANPLKTVIGGGRERQLIVIDALDEAGEAGRNPLVEMLARHAPRLPDWLGLVVTSRPESAVQTPLQGLNPFVLDTRTEANRADLRDYLRHELAPQLQHRPDADRLIGEILERSEGVFLYAERFCDDVQHGHLSLDRPEQFPQGLGGIFCQYFQRQFPDLEKFRKDVRPALRAILAAREPLPVEILQRLFNWQDEELRDFTCTLGSLFPVITEAGQEVIKPYHKSLADWLADDMKSGPYFVSVSEGHQLLAEYGWNAVMSAVDNSPAYITVNLPWHLVAIRNFTSLVALLHTQDYALHMRRLRRISNLLRLCSEVLKEMDVPQSHAIAIESWLCGTHEDVLGREIDARNRRELPWSKPWERQDETHKAIFQAHASDLLRILKTLGFIVQLAMDPREVPLIEFSTKELERLARREHDRWCRERVASGWSYGSQRDPENKRTPFLVSWHDLSDEIRRWDYADVLNWPKLLSQIGYEIKRGADGRTYPGTLTDREMVSGEAAACDSIIERLAELLYRQFYELPEIQDPASAAWGTLSLEFKEVIWQEASDIIINLECVGFGVRPVSEGQSPIMPMLEGEVVERLAGLEHDRWCRERRALGWTYASKRDVDRLQSPYLVPWPELPEEAKEYNRLECRNCPELLAHVGYEIYLL